MALRRYRLQRALNRANVPGELARCFRRIQPIRCRRFPAGLTAGGLGDWPQLEYR